ncbi:two-component system response regulator BtsR [Malonomonas rubra]|uniref:two-component system response regulator BtsR n=1 Tax=Malonomonas rubra TaxID=57040 RepID=UPI0026ED7981|nr:two-component system response regulator BtsR [Malonomonas rubra]
MIRGMIVDDELNAREELATLLADISDIEIVASCGNAIEAIKLINKKQPQILFLDIQMPVIDGFELLSMIDEESMPHVVFVTAFDQYALKAFEEKTLDYLLKPIDPERLQKTMAKIEATLQKGSNSQHDSLQLSRIPCARGHKIKLIDPQEVELIHSDLTGVHVFTAEDKYFTELTLKVLEQQLGLLRCHKQYLVNLQHVVEITTLENGLAEIKTRSGQQLPVSRRYLRSLKDAFHL